MCVCIYIYILSLSLDYMFGMFVHFCLILTDILCWAVLVSVFTFICAGPKLLYNKMRISRAQPANLVTHRDDERLRDYLLLVGHRCKGQQLFFIGLKGHVNVSAQHFYRDPLPAKGAYRRQLLLHCQCSVSASSD